MKKILLCLLVTCLPLYSQNFSDGFESGNFSTGGWTTSGGVSIVSSPTYSGSYAAKGTNAYSFIKSFNSVSSGICNLIVYIRVAQKSTNCAEISLLTSTDAAAAQVFFRYTGNIEAYNGSSNTVIYSGYTSNTWYKISINYNLSTKKYDVYINDVQKASSYNSFESTAAIGKFRLRSQETSGTIAYIDDITFTTTSSSCPPPSAVTNAATNISNLSATLNGSGDPGYCQTSGWFEFGLTTNYGNTTSPITSLGSGTSSVTFSYSLSGLSAGKTYHFRAVTQSSGGTTYGSDRTFTTTGSSCPPPSAVTNAATNISNSSATLNGSGDPGYCLTSGWFEWGLTTNYGYTTSPITSLGSGTSSVAFSYSLSGLNAGTTYHFRAVTQSSGGTTYGSDRILTTITVDLNEKENLPFKYSLSQNYPNPFNPITTIQYQIPRKSNVSLKLYDALGNEVATLVNEEKSTGIYEVLFDGSNYSSGVYFYHLQTDLFSQTNKFVLMK